MTTSGRDARRSPEAIAPAGSSGSAGRPRTSSPDNKSAARLLGLAVLIHMLRSRRFYERVVVGVIAAAGPRALGQENRASTLSAWLPGINGRSSSLSAERNGTPGTLSAKPNGTPGALPSAQANGQQT